MPETTITNATILLPNELTCGSLSMAEGRIRAIDSRPSVLPAAIDFEGDYLIPGLVDIHTDNLEKHVEPRPGVRWPIIGALTAHDRQIAASGITTVFDSLAIGYEDHKPGRRDTLLEATTALTQFASGDVLKAQHFLHLRCEISSRPLAGWLEHFVDNPLVRLVSVMDHTPGQRQWRDISKWQQYNRNSNMSAEDVAKFLERRQSEQATHAAANRKLVLESARYREIPVASHDDTTAEHIYQAAADGIKISEFPTTIAAAKLAREHGMKTIMGAPNVVKGGSHSGNVSAQELAALDLLDGLASDYVPTSMLHSAFILRDALEVSLHRTIGTVTSQPAAMAGLEDRGEIAVDRRADLIRVREIDSHPVVVSVWRAGKQVI